MSQRLGLWAKGAPGMAEGKLEVLEKFFQPSWAWEQESSRTSSSSLGSSIHPRQLGKGSLIGCRDLGDRLRFSAFLDELIFPQDQLSEMQTQPDLPEPQGGPLDTGSTAEDDGDGDPEFSLGQVCQELMTLKEQFLRLQEDLASTHRAHQVLEEKLQSLVCLRAGASPEKGRGGGQPAPAPTPGSYPNSFYSSPSGPRCSFS